MLGCAKGIRCSVVSYGLPQVPLTPPSITGKNREKRGLPERSQIASSAAPVLTEKRREPLALARGKLSGVFFFAFFLLDKQKKEGLVR